MSWNDEIHAAKPGIPRALVHLERAQQRGSKGAAAGDINDALAEAGLDLTISDLLNRYDLGYSLEGLAEAAARLAEEFEEYRESGSVPDGLFSEGPSIEELIELLETTNPVVWALLDALQAYAEGDTATGLLKLMEAVVLNSVPRDRDHDFAGVDGVRATDDSIAGTVHYVSDAVEVEVPI